MRRPQHATGGEDWATARALAVYAVSAHAAAHGLLAWAEPGAAGLAATLLGLAVAEGSGLVLVPEALRLGDAGSRRRARLALRASYGCLACVGLSTALAAGTAQALGLAVFGFVGAQGVILAAAALEPRSGLALLNALILVLLAGLRGGPVAAVAVVGAVALLPFPLAYEHFAGRLPPGRRRASLLGAATRQAAELAAPPALALAAAFLFWPPATYAPVRPQVARLSREAVEQAYQRAMLLGLLSGGVVLVLVRLSRRRRSQHPHLNEPTEPETVVDEPLPAPEALPRMRLPPGHRGRVVRAYLSVLASAQREGWRRGAGLTPREILRRLGDPSALRHLTALFETARYGPWPMSEEDARTAEAEAASLRRRHLAPSRSARVRDLRA